MGSKKYMHKSFEHYGSGHQLYSDPQVLQQMVGDLDRFYDEATHR